MSEPTIEDDEVADLAELNAAARRLGLPPITEEELEAVAALDWSDDE